ncbi:MAG: YceI family protein [Flammeovirgaceae bacterium]
MKYIKVIGLICCVFLVCNLHAQQAINTAKSSVEFTIDNLGLEVEGRIRGLTGQITFDERNLSVGKFSISIPVKGLRTDNKMRDEHLQEEEFFHVAKYPKITFVSERIEQNSNGYQVMGKLTIKGKTKEVVIPFRKAENRFWGQFSLDRKDYDIGGNGFLNTIGDEVNIKINCIVGE